MREVKKGATKSTNCRQKMSFIFTFTPHKYYLFGYCKKIQKPLQWVRELWLQFDTWKLKKIDVQSGIYVILNISKLKGQCFSLTCYVDISVVSV